MLLILYFIYIYTLFFWLSFLECVVCVKYNGYCEPHPSLLLPPCPILNNVQTHLIQRRKMTKVAAAIMVVMVTAIIIIIIISLMLTAIAMKQTMSGWARI